MDSAVFSDRVTLPEHLREVLEVLLLKPCVVFLPHELRDDLRSALAEAEKTAAAGVESEKLDEAAVDENDNKEKQASQSVEVQPPTISYDLLKRVSQWARKNDSMGCIKRASCDPSQYTIVSLLAGTQVYYPPKHRERLQAATSNTSTPYLPSYLNPAAPTLVQEYRSLAKEISTALNVLFSTLGAGFAVFLAAKGGAGYAVDVAALLGIATAVVVCIAEMGLLYIVGQRRDKERLEDRKVAAKVMRGSGAIEPAPAPASNTEDQDIPPEDIITESKETAATSTEKRSVRLRRRELPSKPPS